MWFFDDAFTAPATSTATQWGGSIQWDNVVQSNEVVVATASTPVLDAKLDSTVAPAGTDVVFEAPIFASESDAPPTSQAQEFAPLIVSQEAVTMSPVVAPPESTPTESIAVFEPIITTPVVAPEIILTPTLDTVASPSEIESISSAEMKTESSLDVWNPEKILDDTERLLRQSEEALENQAKFLESEAALHQEKSDEEKKAADSALQAAQSAHAKADKLEATITSIQKEKAKLSVSA